MFNKRVIAPEGLKHIFQSFNQFYETYFNFAAYPYAISDSKPYDSFGGGCQIVAAKDLSAFICKADLLIKTPTELEDFQRQGLHFPHGPHGYVLVQTIHEENSYLFSWKNYKSGRINLTNPQKFYTLCKMQMNKASSLTLSRSQMEDLLKASNTEIPADFDQTFAATEDLRFNMSNCSQFADLLCAFLTDIIQKNHISNLIFTTMSISDQASNGAHTVVALSIDPKAGNEGFFERHLPTSKITPSCPEQTQIWCNLSPGGLIYGKAPLCSYNMSEYKSYVAELGFGTRNAMILASNPELKCADPKVIMDAYKQEYKRVNHSLAETEQLRSQEESSQHRPSLLSKL